MRLQIGVDVGGTFTDLYGLDTETGVSRIHKVSSSPTDPSSAIMQGVGELLEKFKATGELIDQLAHGTTVGTNALLQRRGPDVALLTTTGFRDLLEVGRQTRPFNYDMHTDFAPPVVPRWRRFEVDERILADGSVHKELTDDAIAEAVDAVRRSGAQAVAVCFLFSYLAPEHEQRLKAALTAALPDLSVSTSSEVQPEFREYERFSTTAANAYLQPVMEGYLAKLEAKALEKLPDADVLISHSSGGLMSLDTARRFPIRTALSGPAAGVAGAQAVARSAARPDVITFDMGGTSADVAMIRGLEFGESFDRRIGGLPIRMPMVDINTVGAGGGSIAWIDRDGSLKVGPQSAGAHPGPACYGLGGTEATVTDANLVLGRLSAKGLLGGAMNLDRDLAVKVVSALADRIGLGLEATARGILAIVVSNMVRAIRVISVERGFDPRDFSLLAFGGAGPLHAREVAASLSMSEIIVPSAPGILCASGLIAADLKESFVSTIRMPLDETSSKDLDANWADLSATAERWFLDESVPHEMRVISGNLEMRYVGQNFELSVPLAADAGNGRIAMPPVSDVLAEFFALHERSYGYFNAEDAVEVVNLRLTARRRETPQERPPKPAISGSAPVAVEERHVFLGEDGPASALIYERGSLRPGTVIAGPAVVEQMDTTTILFKGDILNVDDAGNLIITLHGDGHADDRARARPDHDRGDVQWSEVDCR